MDGQWQTPNIAQFTLPQMTCPTLAPLSGMIAKLPGLWDVNINDYSLDMGLSLFVQEVSLEHYVKSIKALTSKPIVSVGKFTSSDTMVDKITRDVLDFIGATRPSIAEPFGPKEIEEGRLEDIRQCIGCMNDRVFA